MKNLLATGLILFLSSMMVLGQNLNFDIKDFNEKTETVDFLYKYDAIAWWTSDSVMMADSIEKSSLGNDWFCFESKDRNWHAVYGKYENGKYDMVFHYLVDTSMAVKRIYEKVDTALLNGYSRALRTANSYFKTHMDSVRISFNQYIRQNDDKSYDVWILPAFQQNGWGVYGKDFIARIDKSGTKVIEDKSFYDSDFRGFDVQHAENRNVWIDQTGLEKPTLGAIVFVWFYKKYFASIKIDNKHYVSTAIKDGQGRYIWSSFEKTEKK